MNDMSWPLASLIGCVVCTLGSVAGFAILTWAAYRSRKKPQ